MKFKHSLMSNNFTKSDMNEIKKFQHETLESLSKLSLNNHPFKFYVENLFNRRN